MPSIRDSLDPVGHARLGRFLRQGADAALTSTLCVSGQPGGAVQMRRGLVVGVLSPGAPGVHALLARTGRVGHDDRERDDGSVQRAGGAIGAAHLNVIQVMATQDALFAILAGSIDMCWFDESQAVPAGDGVEAAELLRTAFRKLAALATFEHAILPHRERLAPVRALSSGSGDRGDADAGAALLHTDPVREHILRYADGRRTACDIAFLAGRSLYAVTVEMSRMLAEGILHEPPRSPTGELPRLPADQPPRSPTGELPRSPADQPPADEVPLVRPYFPARQPGTRRTEEAPAQKTTNSWRDFLRFGGRAGEGRT